MRSFPTISSQVTDTAYRNRYLLFFFFLLFRPFFSSLIVISPVLWFYHGDWNLSLGDVYILIADLAKAQKVDECIWSFEATEISYLL